MNTSYYSKSWQHPNAVSIAGKCPEFYTGRQFRALAPKLSFFLKYKSDGDESHYIECYNREVLGLLDARIVYDVLGSDAVLLCWEDPNKFCHRHLIADWFQAQLGINVTELD